MKYKELSGNLKKASTIPDESSSEEPLQENEMCKPGKYSFATIGSRNP